MTLPKPEFSRPFWLDALSDDRDTVIKADEAERTLIARRFGLLSVTSLTAQAALHHGTHGVDATGRMVAVGEQACVVTGDPVRFALNEPFAIRFVAPDDPTGEDEIELSEADLDIVEHDGNVIDLGEAVAQTLGLALNPFPRSPGAQAKLKEAGVLDEGAAGPFGALAALKAKMGEG